MAPMIDDYEKGAVPSNDKPTVYLIDTFHPKAVEHARSLFNVILNTDKELTGWQQKVKAIMIRSSYMRADDIAKCPNLIAIGKHGVGIDKIDKEACDARGIKILNAPGANAQAVAEIVVALAMAVVRNIPSIYARQLSQPVPKETCKGQTLYGKTVGIIGMGHIGRKVAQMLQGGFAAQIVAYDPMIAYAELRGMERTAIVVNGARGGIVDEADRRALRRAVEAAQHRQHTAYRRGHWRCAAHVGVGRGEQHVQLPEESREAHDLSDDLDVKIDALHMYANVASRFTDCFWLDKYEPYFLEPWACLLAFQALGINCILTLQVNKPRLLHSRVPRTPRCFFSWPGVRQGLKMTHLMPTVSPDFELNPAGDSDMMLAAEDMQTTHHNSRRRAKADVRHYP
ncbi:hypothetical protein PG994_011606 [Apiospora phragmitis]|uniref:D-3-phosphoglycerate dehydrogenase n=1 Tax=Apiospora phragmitis TaxID=2905665 RepID=A0ABR1TT94_9PEZI